MFSISEYEKWMDTRAYIDYAPYISSDLQENVAGIIKKCKFPRRLYGFLFLSEERGFKKLNTFYLPDKGEYSQKTYYENEAILVQHTIICTSNGSALCIHDETGIVEVVDYKDFTTSFVNQSFEEFMEFFLYYGKLMSIAEDLEKMDTHIERISNEDLNEFETKIKNAASKPWSNYEYWESTLSFFRIFV